MRSHWVSSLAAAATAAVATALVTLDMSVSGQMRALLVGAVVLLVMRLMPTRRDQPLVRDEVDDLSRRLHATLARQRLAVSERVGMEAVLDRVPDGVLVTDSSGRIVVVNHAARGQLGVATGAASLRDIDAEELTRVIDATAEGAFRETRHLTLDLAVLGGPPQPITATIERQGTWVVTVLREPEAIASSSHSQRHRDFVAQVSHELRTPLTSIRAYVEMLLDDDADDDASRQHYTRIIDAESERLERVLDMLLDLSRIESGRGRTRFRVVDLGRQLEAAVRGIEPQAEAKKIQLVVELDTVTPLVVHGDEDMLHQVAINLISNAIKYTPEGGLITAHARGDEVRGHVTVSVTDSGFGIAADALPRIYDKFYRSAPHATLAPGTGLGLSLCKQIVESVHQGEIGVESRVGRGSRFWYVIPYGSPSLRLAA